MELIDIVLLFISMSFNFARSGAVPVEDAAGIFEACGSIGIRSEVHTSHVHPRAKAPVCSKFDDKGKGYTEYCCQFWGGTKGAGSVCILPKVAASTKDGKKNLYHVCCNGRRQGDEGSWDYAGGCKKVRKGGNVGE